MRHIIPAAYPHASERVSEDTMIRILQPRRVFHYPETGTAPPPRRSVYVNQGGLSLWYKAIKMQKVLNSY